MKKTLTLAALILTLITVNVEADDKESLSNQISGQQELLVKTNDDLYRLKLELTDTENQINETKQQIDYQAGLMAEQARIVQSDSTYRLSLFSIMTSKSLTDAIQQLNSMNQLFSANNDKLLTLQELTSSLENLKIDQEKQLTELNTTKTNLTNQLSELETSLQSIKDKEAAEQEKAKAETIATAVKATIEQPVQKASTIPNAYGEVQFGSDGLLVMQQSAAAQNVVNLLFAIPGGMLGASYHVSLGIDDAINQLSVEEAVWVIYRVEGPGFGQVADGLAGIDSPATHQAFVERQLNTRFGGSIHELLRRWGTFSYNGY